MFENFLIFPSQLAYQTGKNVRNESFAFFFFSAHRATLLRISVLPYILSKLNPGVSDVLLFLTPDFRQKFS